MEKELVKQFDLEAAFKALDDVEIPEVKGIIANRPDLKERFAKKSADSILVEDYYNIGNNEALEEAADDRNAEIAKAKLAKIEKIVDLDADTPEDLQPSYVGKLIVQCPQCMTLFYKNAEDIEKSEENPDVVNVNEVCQHCGNTSGYTLIGKVDTVSEEEAQEYEEADEETKEENELDLNFEEPTEEVDAEGTGDGAEEMSDEDDKLNLDLDIKETGTQANESLQEQEEAEEIPAEEEAPVEEPVDEPAVPENSEEISFTTEEVKEVATDVAQALSTPVEDEEEAEKQAEEIAEVVDEKVDAAIEEKIEADADIEIVETEKSEEEKVEEDAENLNEALDKNLDKKLEAHNEYIDYLKKMIEQEEEALKKTENEEVKAAIQRRLDAFKEDLEAALPNAVKDELQIEDLPTPEEAEMPEEPEDIKEEKEEVKEEEKTYKVVRGDDESKVEFEGTKEECEEVIENNKDNEKVQEHDGLQIMEEQLINEDSPAERAEKLDKFEASLPEDLDLDEANKNEVVKALKDYADNLTEEKELAEGTYDVSDAEFSKMLKSAVFNEDLPTDAQVAKLCDAIEHAGENGEEVKNIEEINNELEAEKDEKPEEPVEVEEQEIDLEQAVESFNEGTFNNKVNAFLTEVYSNVKDFETTDCKLNGNKLVVEGNINFNSGNQKHTIFEFTPSGNNGKLVFEGYNKDFSTDRSFKLNTQINEEKELVTESLEYKFKINTTLVEGLK